MTDLDRAALAWIVEHRQELADEVIAICEIPAPTFDESRRAAHLRDRLETAGLSVETDELGNLLARVAGTSPGPRTLLVAHLDTVFPNATDVHVVLDGDLLRGPGIGDDAAGLGALVGLARLLRALEVPFPGELLLAATVGEEGLGDLRGMRALMNRLGRGVDQVVALDTELEEVVTEAVGSRRYRVRVEGPGGHSWSDYGAPSAVHLLAEAVGRILKVTVPETPRTTINVGTFHGGTTVNAIAARAELLLDLRSVHGPTLEDFETRVLAVLDTWSAEVQRSGRCTVRRERVGDRPAGRSDNAALVEAIRAAGRALDLQLTTTASSTDASVPLSLGIPAAAMGVHRGGGAHSLDEWLDPASLETGLSLLYLTVMALQR